jgi:hypothetical protein
MAVRTASLRHLDVIADDARPNITMSTVTAQALLDELRERDVRNGGIWVSTPTAWQRFSRPWATPDDPAGAQLVGSIYVIYGIPTTYELTIHRATVTPYGQAAGWTPELVCADVLTIAGYTLDDCGRVELPTTPR